MKRRFRVESILALALALASGIGCLAQDEAPAESLVLQDAAANLQNDGKFDLAVGQWSELVEKFPNTKSTNVWRYHLGTCQEKTSRHEEAIASFQAVVSKASPDFTFLPEAWLHLGYNQWMQAKSLADKSDRAPQAKELAAAAAASFGTLLEKFPQNKLKDQAIYFLGEANVTGGQLDAAISAFDRLVVEVPDSKFWSDAVFALGSCQEEKGALEKALLNYDRYLEKAPQGRQANEVQFRKAETLLQFGLAAEKAGDAPSAKSRYAQAEKLYGQLAQLKDFSGRETSSYQRAVALARTDQVGLAAAAFAQFASDFPNSEVGEQALIAAGQNFIKAKDFAAAVTQLNAALQKNPKSSTAIHWLCRAHLAAQHPDQAWKVAETGLTQIDATNPSAAQLLMDQADAAYAMPDKVADSVRIYLTIVDQFPQHALAPQALYNAAFSSLVAKNPDRAIELAEKFYAAYKADSFLPDVQEVHAEAALQKQQWDAVEKIYRHLLADHPDHQKSPSWRTALTQALVLAGKNDEAIQLAAPTIEKLSGRAQAEMLFHVGSAQFQARQFDQAVTSLTRSLQADSKWSRADEVALLAARAEFRAGKTEQGIARAEKCLNDNPKSAIRDQILFRLGEFQFESDKFDPAIGYYAQVLKDWPNSTYAASALYGRGWAELRSNKPKEAIASFDELIKRFPQNALAKDAMLARGMAQRRSGDLTAAVADLDRYLGDSPTEAEKLEALYERALIDIDRKNHDAVIAQFESLLKLIAGNASAKKWADKCHYELAWAYKAKNAADKSLEHFAALVKDYPDSPLAAEAEFHLGEASYDAGQFDSAIAHYAAAKQRAGRDAELSEKASYKLAWAQYKKQDYQAAEASFRKQLSDFPQGPLKADGMFMISESLFRQKQHVAAVTAYKAALPEVQASPNVREDVKMLTILHGAQSANEAQQFDQAIAFLRPWIEGNSVPAGYAAEAWFEYGQALKGAGQTDPAIEAWGKAQSSFDKTGIRARCMIAEALFENKKFDDAIKEFTLAVYGYGGREAADSVKPWQAFAAYELARCNLVQISSADAAARPKLIQEAKTWFHYLIDHYPEDHLTAEAKSQIAKLEKM